MADSSLASLCRRGPSLRLQRLTAEATRLDLGLGHLGLWQETVSLTQSKAFTAAQAPG